MMGQQSSHASHSSFAFQEESFTSYDHDKQPDINYNSSIPQRNKANTQNPSHSARPTQNKNTSSSDRSFPSSSSTSSNAFGASTTPSRKESSQFSDRRRPSEKNKTTNGMPASGNPQKKEPVKPSPSGKQKPKAKSSKPSSRKPDERKNNSTSNLNKTASTEKTSSNNHSNDASSSQLSKIRPTPLSVELVFLEGDEFFTIYDMQKAEDCYSRALNMISKNHSDKILLFNRRATVFLQQQKFVECLQDCALAIKMAQRSIHNKHTISRLISNASSSFVDQIIKALATKAQALMELKRYLEATQVYKKIISKDKSRYNEMSENIRNVKINQKEEADNLYRARKFKEAEQAYTEAIIMTLPEKDGDLALLLSNRAACLMMQHGYTECLKDCNAAIDTICIDMKAKYSISPLLVKSGNTKETLLVKILFRKARAFEKLERYHAAIEAYRTILYFDKNQEDRVDESLANCKVCLYWEQGNTYYENGNVEEALASYTNALGSFPGNPCDRLLLLSRRANILAEEDRYEECLKDCETAIRYAKICVTEEKLISSPLMKSANTSVKPLVIDMLRLQVKVFGQLYNCKKELREYKELISSITIPEDPQLLNKAGCIVIALLKERGNFYYRNGQFEEAVRWYRRAANSVFAEDCDWILFYNNEAAGLVELRKFTYCLLKCDNAIALATRNIANNVPRSLFMQISQTTYKAQLIKLHFRKGQAYEGLGELEEATKEYKKSLTLSNSSSKKAAEGIWRCKMTAYQTQGDKYYANGEFEKAQVYYTQGINVLPEEHSYLITLYNSRAATFMALDKYEECLEDCKFSIMLAYNKKAEETHLVEALERKAEALELLKRYQAAIITYEEIMDVIGSRNMVPDIKRCEKLYKIQLEEEEEARTSEAVKEMREREKQKKAEEEEKAAKQDVVDEKIKSWKKGKYGYLREFLCSLDSILWPEVLVKNTNFDMSSSAKDCKKLYMRVIAKIHDDKLPQNVTIEQRLLANRVFQVLNESYNEFRVSNDL